MMIGEPHAPKNPEREGTPSNETRLAVSALRTAEDGGRKGLSIDSINVHAHEIVGIAGVSGNGQKDLVEVLGGQRLMESGQIVVDGAPYDASRGQSQAHDVRVLPEEPLRNGCVPPMTVVDNLNLRSFDLGPKKSHRGWLDRAGMAARAKEMIAAYGIRTPSPQAPIGVLSGGNVQRCVLARELDGDVRLLIVANPCFGLDVKAVAETRARIMAARTAGTAVLLISEDLDEILELADRIVVMHEGRVAHEMPAEGADPQEIGRHMLGHH
jgi:general nucleoside transport system ATP-binding protein